MLCEKRVLVPSTGVTACGRDAARILGSGRTAPVSMMCLHVAHMLSRDPISRSCSRRSR